MRIMNFTRRVLSCVLFAACVMTANAVERLMVVGDGVWGGWSIDNSIVMFNTAEQPDVWEGYRKPQGRCRLQVSYRGMLGRS